MNQLYPSAKQAFLEGALDWLNDPIYAILIDTRYYTFSPNHETLEDFAAEAFIKSSSVLTGKTATGGIADAADVTFAAVTAGPVVNAMILVKDGGTAINSPVIAYLDSAVNLPYTPDGTPILLSFDNGPSKIFSL